MSVRVAQDGAVVTVTIDRMSRKNAVDRATAESLAEVFARFDSDDSARVAVLTGAHGTFCAGADLKAVSEGQANRLDADGDGPMGPTRMHLRKPVIAAIEGHAVAGGLELALWCDLRVAAQDAILGVFCRRWGVPLIDGGTVRLPRIVGMGRALDLILTGRAVTADEALAMGLVSRVVAPGSALAEAQSLANTLAELPQGCMRADRESAYAQWELPMAGALAHEFDGGLRALFSEGIDGAKRFASGEGRHGAAVSPTRKDD
ncbi:MAG: crotonase/enoyl-CoA hydratase family protein [Deltaproteobacteria bacterium]|nr:crotonase/enoyl-CoA hydratase family protein [Deltaproteobacteria bacterium]